MSVTFPNFFIVGAPKCGTTALCNYISQHPSAFIPNRKELHFFGTDLGYHYRVSDINTYLKFFSEAESYQVRGEGSVWYLLSKQASSEIKQFNPNAKIIIMLRNPVDLLYSLHAQYLYNEYENVKDFSRILYIEEQRRHGINLPKKITSNYGLVYKEAAHFRPQIERYLGNFDRKNVHIIIYEKFRNDTVNEMRKLERFLNLETHNKYELGVVNASKKWRNIHLHNFFEDPPDVISKMAGTCLMANDPIKAGRWVFRKIDRSLNLNRKQRPELDPLLRKNIRDKFTDDIKYVEQLIGMKLDCWWE